MPGMTQAGYRPPKMEKPAPKKSGAPQKHKKKKRQRISGAAIVSLVILLAAVIIGAGTLWVFARTNPYQDVFLPGIYLSGEMLTGLTRAQGEAKLAQMTEASVYGWRFELEFEDTTYTLTAEECGLAVDAAATLDPLWTPGREGGMLGRLAAMMKLRVEPVLAEPVVTYSMEEADALLETVRLAVDRDPVDAKAAFTPGSSEPFAFTDDAQGLKLDTAPVRDAIERALAAMAPGRIILEPERIAPAVTRKMLEEACVLRGRAVLTIQADEAAAQNIALAAGKLNGAVIAPGETLSFNDTVGARTAQAGYLEAEEEAYGLGAAGVGGGVCAVSTALYQAALLGDIPVQARSAAVRPVSYSPMGQEAAVSGQGLDLVLGNDTKTPVYLTARTYPAQDAEKKAGTKAVVVEIQLIGAPLSCRYALETQALETGMIEEPLYIRDRDGVYATYTDEKVPVGEGEPGYSALVELVSFDETGKETGRTTVSEDSYAPLPPTIYVGAKERQ